MATVKVHTKDGQVHELECAPGDEAFYDDLPFTSENVTITEIR